MTGRRVLLAGSLAALLALAGCSGGSDPAQNEPAPLLANADASVHSPHARGGSAETKQPKNNRHSNPSSGASTSAGGGAPAARPNVAHDAGSWNGLYGLDGDVTYHPSVPWSGYDLPETMNIQYTSRGGLLFYAESEPEPDVWYGVGMIVDLVTKEGNAINRLSLITPNRGGGTVTFGFVLAHPVRWLSLRSGETSRSVTENGKYVLSINRLDTAAWQIAVTPNDGAEPEPWFERGLIVIKASSPTPPWTSLTLDFDTVNSQSRASGHLELQRQKP